MDVILLGSSMGHYDGECFLKVRKVMDGVGGGGGGGEIKRLDRDMT